MCMCSSVPCWCCLRLMVSALVSLGWVIVCSFVSASVLCRSCVCIRRVFTSARVVSCSWLICLSLY